MSSPTQRTLALFQESGWIAGITEKWNQHVKIRQDLFGWIDVLAYGKGIGVVGIQATSTPNISSRKEKIEKIDGIDTWLSCDNIILVIGWKKYKKPINRKVWRPTLWTFDFFDEDQKWSELEDIDDFLKRGFP